MDAWERMFRDEREDLEFFLSQEFKEKEMQPIIQSFHDEVRQIARDSAHRHMAVLAEIEEGLPIPVIPVEDELIHTEDHPFCDDYTCLCHYDNILFDERIEQPVMDGLMTTWEANNLRWNENI